jgi:hypothetical protein
MPSNNKSDKYKYVDYLTEDTPLAGQSYVCLSFISPEGVMNCKTRGLKVRGMYSTEEEAKARCTELNAIDPDFDVFIGEVGKWLPWNPDPAESKNQVYREKELNDIVEGHHKNLNKAKQLEAERKTELLKKSLTEEKSRKTLVKEQNSEKVEKNDDKQKFINDAMDKLETDNVSVSSKMSKSQAKRHKNKAKKLNDLSADISEKHDVANKEGERLRDTLKNIDEAQNAIDGIDKDIDTIKKLYAKLKQKQDNKKKSVESAQ